MNTMSPKSLITKAKRAIESAKLLHEANDVDGACNRAYYAMFDAAKAALLATMPSIDLAATKTHSGLIPAFGQHIVKTKLVPIEYGRAFNRAHDIRQIADYTGDLIEHQDVSNLLQQAIDFVDVIEADLILKNHNS